MFKKTLLLFCFVFLGATVFSQSQLIFEDAKTESFLVKFPSNQVKSPITQILTGIAEGNKKTPANTQFAFTYLLKSKIYKKGTHLEFIVSLDEIHFIGDILYKEFPLLDILFPYEANFQLNWLNSNGQVIKTFPFMGVIMEGDPKVLVDIDVPDSLGLTGYKIETGAKNFVYNNVNKRMFTSRTDLINEYYTLDPQLKMAHNELMAINLDNTDMIYQYKAEVEKNDLLLKSISNKDFYNQLSLSVYDPIQLDEKMTELFDLNNKIRQSLNYIINNMFEVFYKKGMDYLSTGNVDAAVMYFNKSINSNLFFAPAHLQIAKINYGKKNYEAAIEGVKNITQNMKPDPQTLALAIELGAKIMDDYLKKAKQLLLNSQFDKALDELKNAKEICQSVTGVICTDELSGEYIKAIQGWFNQYIFNADQSIRGGNLESAEENINAAKNFIQSYSEFHINPVALDNVSAKLFAAYWNKGKEEATIKNFEMAIKIFEKARYLCLTNADSPCSEELYADIYNAKNGLYLSKLDKAQAACLQNNLAEAQAILDDAIKYQKSGDLKPDPKADQLAADIKSKIYTNLIDEGKKYANEKKYTEAILKFEAAKQMESQYPVKADKTLPAQITASAKSYILAQLSNGTDLVFSNDLNAARKYFNTAKEYQNKYNLTTDAEVDKSITGLKDQIFSQECKNAQSAYDAQFGTVAQLTEQSKYIEAETAITATLKISEQNKDCEISTTKAEEKRSEILPAVTYQKLIVMVEECIKVGKYQEAIDKYIETEKYFYELKVGKFALTHVALFDYLKKCNSDFVNFCVKYYCSGKDYDKALALLEELQIRKFNPKWAKESMEMTARNLAAKDKAANPSGDPKKIVLAYTHENKWYKIFVKAYLRKWDE